MPYFILIILTAVGVFTYKKLNRFIKGNHDLLYDCYALYREVAIIIFISSFFASLYFGYRNIATGGETAIKGLTLSLILFFSYLFYLFVLWRLYNCRYREDRESFTYTTLFKQERVLFKEMKRVKYYRRKDAAGFHIETLTGKKYYIGHGFLI